MKSQPAKALVAALCATSLLSGCVTNGGNGNFLSTTPGANGECEYNEAAYVIGGALLGIGIGLLAGGDNRGVATVAGGAAGGLIGKGLQSYLQNRCEELAAVQKQMKESELKVQAVNAPAPSSWVNPDASSPKEGEQGIIVTVSNAMMFATGSSAPTKSAAADLQQLAKTYAGKNRKVLIIGHTDSTGPEQLNRTLSEKRAREVAKIFESSGVRLADLYYKGAGADRPIATNLTAEGRAANRRVEVVELGTEEGIIAYDNFVESDPTLPIRVVKSQEAPDIPQPPQTSKPVTERKPEIPPQTTTTVTSSKSGSSIDFGGLPIDEFDQNLAANVEKNQEEKTLLSSLWPVSEAKASNEDDIMLGTACINDSYRPVGSIMSLDGDMPVYRTSDYIPGLYSTSWHDTVNGHLIGLTKVAVLEDSGLVDKSPGLFVFENYKKGDQAPTLSAEGSARSYIGANGVVYRVFFNEGAWPVRCVDTFFPRNVAQQGLAQARIYYNKDNKVFANEMHLKTAKRTEQ